ncbi:MAG: metallophosphoesterase family protein [Eubacteriales bacterium]|nr:metallophosphoesterase family protein [Eubacteriales bacterium]
MNARVSKICATAPVIPIDDSSKFVLISDCHRGDGGHADTFLKNRHIYYAAIRHYYKQGYAYIELGDGDELWENRALSDIIYAHKDVFWLLSDFYRQGRLYFICGNHDIVKYDRRFAPRSLYYYFDTRQNEQRALFPGIRVHEGLVLRHAGGDILLIHGHQADLWGTQLWRLGRFLVRYFWKPLETFGVNDPTSAAKNYRRKKAVETRLTRWARANNTMLIAGHTHRPMFPDPGQPLYFNDGSCVHPRCITAIEISGGDIRLVKWEVTVQDDGTLCIGRETVAGPERLSEYFG